MPTRETQIEIDVESLFRPAEQEERPPRYVLPLGVDETLDVTLWELKRNPELLNGRACDAGVPAPAA